MSGVLVLDRRQTAAALEPAGLLDAVGRALVAVARGEVSVPPRIAALTPAGLLGAMPGYVAGLGAAAKLVSVTADPEHPGRSFHRGLVVLFDEHDGRALALVDAESLTGVRTAASATHSALALAARPGLGRVAVVGTGAQARAQLALLAAVRPKAEVTVAGRDPLRAAEAAALFPGARVATGVEDAVRTADVVFCCTGATAPVIRREWLSPVSMSPRSADHRGPSWMPTRSGTPSCSPSGPARPPHRRLRAPTNSRTCPRGGPSLSSAPSSPATIRGGPVTPRPSRSSSRPGTPPWTSRPSGWPTTRHGRGGWGCAWTCDGRRGDRLGPGTSTGACDHRDRLLRQGSLFHHTAGHRAVRQPRRPRRSHHRQRRTVGNPNGASAFEDSTCAGL